MAFISRNLFAREELHKEVVYTSCTCKWCGQIKTTKKGKSFLYQYNIQPDSIRNIVNNIEGLFCSISCMKTYYS